MSMFQHSRFGAILLASLLGICLLSGCTGGESGPAAGGGGTTTTPSNGGSGSSANEEVVIDGSSSLGPVSAVASEYFRNEVPDGAKVPVKMGGTGTGFSKLINKQLDVCDASRPIKGDEMAKCKEAGITFIELPICYDALTVVIHPENDWAGTMSYEQLNKLWMGGEQGTGEIMTWDQLDPSWPKESIKLYGADTSSGTFDYFQEAIASKKHRSDYAPSADDNILLEGVAENKNALGYIPYTYFANSEGRVQAVKIIPKGGTEAIAPSAESALSGKYSPLARPLFLYVPSYAAERPAVQQFVEYYITNAEKFSKEVNYLPLSSENYAKVLKRFQERKSGSVYGGEAKIGVTAEQLLEMELVQ